MYLNTVRECITLVSYIHKTIKHNERKRKKLNENVHTIVKGQRQGILCVYSKKICVQLQLYLL